MPGYKRKRDTETETEDPEKKKQKHQCLSPREEEKCLDSSCWGWDPILCSRCHKIISICLLHEPEKSKCYVCSEFICGSCIEICDFCNRYYCIQCMVICGRCGYFNCPECKYNATIGKCPHCVTIDDDDITPFTSIEEDNDDWDDNPTPPYGETFLNEDK